MDFTTLVSSRDTDGSIRNWANYARLPSAQILVEAEAWIYQRLRVREMLTTATGNITSGSTISMPARFRAPKHFMFTGVNHAPVILKTQDFVREAFTYDANGDRATGKPQYFYMDGTNVNFELAVDQTYAYDFLYYQALAALDSTTTTNFLTDRYPTLLRSACMFRAFQFMRNTGQMQHWLAEAQREVFEANQEGDNENASLELEMVIGA